MKLSKLDPFEKTPNRIGELINSSDKSLKQISQEININYETLSAYKRQLRRPKKENAKKNKITQWTPFGEDLAIILAELNQSEALSDYIDFLASKKGFNPVLVKAIKEFIADEKQGLIPFLINKSGAEDSPYHYVWQAWEKTPEYQERMAEKRNK